MIRIILPAYGGGESTGTLFAILTLDRETRDFLLAKIARFREAQAADADLNETVCFNYALEWFDCAGSGRDDLEDDARHAAGDAFVDDTGAFPAGGNLRTECDQLHVGRVGTNCPVEISWTAYIRHTDIAIETCFVTEDFLRSREQSR